MEGERDGIPADRGRGHGPAGAQGLWFDPERNAAVCAKCGLVVFAVAAAAIVAYAVWAGFSGTPLAELPLRMERTAADGSATASVPLTPEMSPVQLQVRYAHRSPKNAGFGVVVTDPHGRILARRGRFTSPKAAGSERAEDPVLSTLCVFPVTVAGNYAVSVRTDGEGAADLAITALVLEKNSFESHFFRNFFLLGAAFAGAVWWWKRRYFPVARSKAAREGPGTPPEAAAPDRSAGAPGTSPLKRLGLRALLEGLELLVSAARVPLLGIYALLIFIAVMGLLGESLDAQDIDKVLQSPWFQRAMDHFFPEGHYEGNEVLWVFGEAAGIVTLALYLLTLPVRMFLKERPRPTFRQRAGRLFAATLVSLVLYAAALLAVGREGFAYEETVGWVVLFAGLLMVPSLLFIAVLARIEAAIAGIERRSRGG
jgi:hypothetical protein